MVQTFGSKATRVGFGEALAELGAANPNIFALGADTAASVSLDQFYKKFPERFVNVGVAEQNMLGMAAGLAVAGYIPFAATYGVFACGRPWEMIRTTICYSNLNVKIGGSHGGLMVGPDGATHQALEEIALMRCLPNMTVLVPCDSLQTKAATKAAAAINGPVYIRYGRESVPVITTNETSFEIGKALTMREGKDVVIFACGNLVYESLMAAEMLQKKNISAKVVNIHTIKPIDTAAIVEAAIACGAVVTAEEHQAAGGMGSAVCEVLAKHSPMPVETVAVNDTFGTSGKPCDLMVQFHLKDVDVAAAAVAVIKRKK